MIRLKKDFLGPASLTKASRFTFDSRDSNTLEHLNLINNSHGVWGCRTFTRCTDVCPKNVAPSRLISALKRNLKSILVGKDAILVGISNSAFQDIIYRAKVFPKRKGSELSKDEKKALFDAIKSLIHERIELGGKDSFIDLYAKGGKYVPKMGPNMKEKTCSECGTGIERMSFGGGQVYYCSTCQEL